MIFCMISRIQGGYKITTEDEKDLKRNTMRYLDYGKNAALREHRRNFNLKGKHLNIIEI